MNLSRRTLAVALLAATTANAEVPIDVVAGSKNGVPRAVIAGDLGRPAR